MAAVVHGVGTTSTSNTTSYASASFTPAAGDLLVVFVMADGTVAAGSLSSSQGLTFHKAGSRTRASVDTIYCFVAEQLASAVSQTVTFSCAGDAATGCIIHVERVSGMAKTGAAAVRQVSGQSNQAAGGTPAPAFSQAALTGNPTLGCVGNASNPATLTPPTGWTERADQGHSTPTTGLEAVSRDSGFTGTTVTWGGTSATAFGSLIVELTADNDAAAAVTLDGVTASAAGAVDVAGAASGTLGSVAISADGTVGSAAISGSASIAVGGLTGAASGAVAVAAAAGVELGAVSVAAAGSVAVAGSGVVALSTVAPSATGAVALAGQAAAELGSVSGSASGAAAIAGQSGIALGAVALSASGGAPATSGELATSLGAIASASAGGVQVAGQATASLGAISGTAAGQVAIIGALLRELAAITAAGAAALPVAGVSGIVLDAIVVAAQGMAAGNEITGAMLADLGGTTLDAAGRAGYPGVGPWQRSWSGPANQRPASRPAAARPPCVCASPRRRARPANPRS